MTPAHVKAPPRRATRTALEERNGSYHLQRVPRAHHSRRTVSAIVTGRAPTRQAANLSGERFARLCAAILDGVATLAANAFPDARQLALRLHADRHEDARLALAVANAFNEIAMEAHRAAEIAATVATGATGAAGEGGSQWP